MHGSTHHRLVAALVLCLAIAAVAAIAPAAATAAIKLGIYSAQQGEVGAPEDARELDRCAAMVGRKPDIVMDYSNITDPLPTPTEVSNLAARGQTPLVTWQLFKSGWGGPTIPLQEIAAGQYDSYLRQAANTARNMPFGEILVRFAHEMNGDWYGWSGSPSAYVNAWRRVVTVFRQQDASNVKFVWSPNVDYGSYPFSGYFPGDSWVDYVALDGYNWGTTGQGPGRWQSLYSVLKSSYDQLTQLSSKPLMIAETSSSETGGSKAAWIREGFLQTIPSQFPRMAAISSRPMIVSETGSSESGGDKAAWVASTLRREIPRLPRIRAVVWFNDEFEDGDGSYRVRNPLPPGSVGTPLPAEPVV